VQSIHHIQVEVHILALFGLDDGGFEGVGGEVG
jgi:hypothetical protein